MGRGCIFRRIYRTSDWRRNHRAEGRNFHIPWIVWIPELLSIKKYFFKNIDKDNSMVITTGKEGAGGKRRINRNGRRLALGWWTHNTIHRWHITELYTWNLYNFVNQCHPNKFDLKNIFKINVQHRKVWMNIKWSQVTLCLYIFMLLYEEEIFHNKHFLCCNWITIKKNFQKKTQKTKNIFCV